MREHEQHNQRIVQKSYEEGEDKCFPGFTVSRKCVAVQWVDMGDRTVSLVSKYLSQLCIATARHTYETFKFVAGSDLFPISIGDWTPSKFSCGKLFWLYVPFPRPQQLEAWLKCLEDENEEKFPWNSIGPMNDGFYVVSLEFTSRKNAILRFIDPGDDLEWSITIEEGNGGNEEGLASKDFSSRARVCSPMQIAVGPKNIETWTAASWGFHSDQQRLRLLPFTPELDIRQFGSMRSQGIHEDLLKEYEVSPMPEHQHVYDKVLAEAKAVLEYTKTFM